MNEANWDTCLRLQIGREHPSLDHCCCLSSLDEKRKSGAEQVG